MLLVKHLTETMEKEPAEGEPKIENRSSLMLGMEIDALIDGLLIGVGFAAGAKAGLTIFRRPGLEDEENLSDEMLAR